MRSIAKVSVLGATVLLLSACGLILGIPGAGEVTNDYDGGAAPDAPGSDAPVSDAAKPDGGSDGSVGDGGVPVPEALLSVSTYTPARLALDGSGKLYFLDYYNQVVAIDLSSKNYTVILPTTSGLDTLRDVAAGPGYVFFTNYQALGNDSRIIRCAASGCGGTLVDVSTDVGYPADIELDGTTLYASYYDGMIRSALNATSGTSALTWKKLTSTSTPTSMVQQGTDVFWAINSATDLFHCSTSGCADNPPAFVAGAVEIPALDATHVYWLERGTNDISTIWANPRGGGQKVALVDKQDWIYAFAVDAAGSGKGNAYFATRFTNKLGQLRSCPKTGGCPSPTVLVDGVDVYDIVVDANYVYYSAGTNVYRLPK